MSLLWATGAWHDARPGTEEWDEYGFGHESKPDRVDRYVRHVQDAHGVDRDSALKALQHVSRHLLEGGGVSGVATDFGFASAPSFSREHSAALDIDGISGARWRHTPVTDVPLNVPVHASQWNIHPSNVAHNLFHPGRRPSRYADENDFGHPDVEPEPWDREDLASAREDERETGPTGAPRMLRQTDGSLLAVDGHHRIAADLLLGKPATRARVVDVRDLGKGGRG